MRRTVVILHRIEARPGTLQLVYGLGLNARQVWVHSVSLRLVDSVLQAVMKN